MNNKELRKLNRRELLEILLEQARRIEALEVEIEKEKLKVDSKKISVDETGTLAEASLKLSGVFKAADDAFELYMKNSLDSIKK